METFSYLHIIIFKLMEINMLPLTDKDERMIFNYILMKIHCYEIFLQTRFTYVCLKLNMNKNSVHSYVCTERALTNVMNFS